MIMLWERVLVVFRIRSKHIYGIDDRSQGLVLAYPWQLRALVAEHGPPLIIDTFHRILGEHALVLVQLLT